MAMPIRRKVPYLSKGRSPAAQAGFEQYNASFILETHARKESDPCKRADLLEAAAETAHNAYRSGMRHRARSEARRRAVLLHLVAAAEFVSVFDMFRAKYNVEMAASAAAKKAEISASAAALRRLGDIEAERVPPVMDAGELAKILMRRQ